MKKNSSILSESVIYLASNIICAAVPLVLLPILTKYLTPAQYGEVAMFQTMIGFFGAFVGLSCHIYVSKKFYDFKTIKEVAVLNGACVQTVATTSGLLIIAVFFFKDWLAKIFGLAPMFLYLGVLVCSALAITQLRLVCWQVGHKPKKYGAIQIGQAVLNFMLSIVFVVFFVMAADGRILAQSVSVLIILILVLYFFYADGLIKLLVFAPKYTRQILIFGIPLIPHVLGVFLLVTVDRFMINTHLGLGQTGIYMVAVQISAGLALLFDGLNKAFVPWLYENLNKKELNADRLVIKSIYSILTVALLGGVALVYCLPVAVKYFIDEQYHGVQDFIGWLVLGQVLAGIYLILANFIFYSTKTGWLSVVSIVCGLINVTLLILLLDSHGVEGAAIAFCVAMGFRVFLTWCVAAVRYPMPWLSGFLHKKN